MQVSQAFSRLRHSSILQRAKSTIWHQSSSLKISVNYPCVQRWIKKKHRLQLEYLPSRYVLLRTRLPNNTSLTVIGGLGWGGLFAVMLMRKLGRLPVLFWSQLIALGFMVGCTFAPTLKTFTGKLLFLNKSWQIMNHNFSSLFHAASLPMPEWLLRVSNHFLPVHENPNVLINNNTGRAHRLLYVTFCVLSQRKLTRILSIRLCRVFSLWQTCTLSTSRHVKYVCCNPDHSARWWLANSDVAQFLDYGLHHVTVHFAIRFRFPRRSR